PNIFNGNITDQANKPVANASIQIPNLNVATQTDKKGYFSFKAQDTVLSVSIASVGFETQNFHLRNKATLNQIILKPAQNNLGEAVVVQSNGAERKKESTAQSKDISIKILDAEPVIGWTAYNDYLQKNKKTTDDTKNIHGNVVVSFEVHSKLVNNFRIEQSLDEDLDAEAIRLIKEGPAWKLLKGKKATVTVTVRF
ncbi:MAG: carboxypeptidase-like regulatory domain-containing protein, partial [Bacteroidota bacterium]